MAQNYQDFRSWILSRSIDGCTIRSVDDDTIVLSTEHAEAKVTFYEVGDGAPRIVEFTILRSSCEDCEPVFHLHFELTDLNRAEELFEEMLEVLLKQGTRETQTVLLCCTTGLTTMMFAEKLSISAASLSLGYTFVAKPLEAAIAEHGSYAAVMLAPQVGYLRKQVAEAFPSTPVFEIPAKIYGAYDATGAIRLLLDALDATTPDAPDLRIVRDVLNDKVVLVVYVNLHSDRTTIRYRLYVGGEVTRSGRVAKLRVDFRDVNDLLVSLRSSGLDFSKVDAVGVVVPGIVDGAQVTFPPSSDTSYDFGGTLSADFGVRVFAENDANAAAVGCYASQKLYENVSIFVQQTGHATGAAGTVIDGKLLKGRRGFAGEIGAVQEMYALPRDADEMRWSPDAVLHGAAAHVIAMSCIVAPDAFYIACDLVPDMDALRAEVAEHLPGGYVPDLVAVSDVRERIFVGMLALCLQRLEAEAIITEPQLA